MMSPISSRAQLRYWLDGTIEFNLDELGPEISALLHKFNEHRLMPANSACVWSPTDTLSRWEIAA